MKREVCATVALVSMVATISLQLMKLPTLSNIALAVALTAWWKSGFRLHIEYEE